jgi:hypothetical protein
MATQSFDNIKILQAAPEVYSACDKIFYGADSTVNDAIPDGYPNASLSNLGFNLADYEIITPVSLGATTLSVNTNGTTVTASTGIFTIVSAPVGKLLWNGSDVNNLRLIGKIASRTSDTVVELTSPYLGSSNLTAVSGYISNVADNNQSLEHKGGFIILVKTVEDIDGKIIPAIKDLKSTGTSIDGVAQGLNTTYVSLNRISSKGSKSSPVSSAVSIPATITRINRYAVSTNSQAYFSTINDIPLWVAYLVNPFGSSSKNFDKNTTYVLEIDEVLPTWDDGGDPKVVGAYVSYVSEQYGFI